MICVTNQVFAVATSDGDVLHATTPNSTEIGLYPDLNKPIFSANGIPYFQYQNTEKSGEIRNTIDKTSCNELISTYPEHFAFYETNKLSKYECHKYALAKLFGYKTMPQWIFHTLIPSSFEYDKYLKSTSNPKKGDLVIYFNSPTLVGATHFGIFDGVNVISTWGTDTDDAYRHAPFFTPGMYGKYIVFYTAPEETDFTSIKKVIEKQNMDKAYSEVLGMLEESDKLSITTASAPFITDDMEPYEVETILRTFKNIKKEDRESIKDLTLFLIDSKVTMVEDIDEIFKEISKIDQTKCERVIADAKIIPINRMTVYDFAHSSSAVVSYFMNGYEISSILKEVNNLPEEGRPEILKDANRIITKLKDRDVSDVIKFTANLKLPSNERSILITSTMALIRGKVHWSDVKDILNAMSRLSLEEQKNFAESHKGEYCSDTNGSFFVYQHLDVFNSQRDQVKS